MDHAVWHFPRMIAEFYKILNYNLFATARVAQHWHKKSRLKIHLDSKLNNTVQF